MPLPTSLSLSQIDTQLTHYERALRPASAEFWATELDRLYLFAAVFKVPMDNIVATTRMYSETLSDLPPSLVRNAITEALKGWRWGNRLPMPADLRAFVSDALERRRKGLRTLTAARAKAAREKEASDAAKKQAEADQWWVEKARARGVTVEALKAEAEAFRARLRNPVDNRPKTPVDNVVKNASVT